MGLLLSGVPEQYGGGGGSFAHEAVVIEELEKFFQDDLDCVPGDDPVDTLQTLAFHRVVQHAFSHAESAEKEEVEIADLLQVSVEHAPAWIGTLHYQFSGPREADGRISSRTGPTVGLAELEDLLAHVEHFAGVQQATKEQQALFPCL